MSKTSSFLREGLWIVLCGLAVGAGVGSALILKDISPKLWHTRPLELIPLAAASGLAVLTGVYGVVLTVLMSRQRARHVVALRDVQSLQRQRANSERQNIVLRERIDELSTLREVAYVVNRETDFEIIAEKVLGLLAGLFEPWSLTIFLLGEDTQAAELVALCEWEGSKVQFGRRIKTRTIPNFELGLFDRYGILVRRYTNLIYVIIPLKVESEVLGAMLMVFAAAGARAEELAQQFNGEKRTLLQEIAQHISLAVKAKHLHTRAVVDGLTRLYTKQHFLEQLEAAVELSQRTGDPLSLIMTDIDYFKKVNDTYGHLSGDIILAAVAGRIKKSLRKYDSAYRYGGEEMAVLLPHTSADRAALIAERLRTSIEKMKLKGEKDQKIAVTISLGVTDIGKADQAEALISRADECLYEAKHAGRNCVVVTQPRNAA